MSNALVVSGAHTATGHPVAVFGPQTGYFAPQLLMLQELQGPGISARGVAFAGRQPLRAARPRPGLRVERHLGRAGHHRHLRGAAVQHRRLHATTQLRRRYLYHGTCTADGAAGADQLLDARPLADSTAGRLLPLMHATAPSTAWSPTRARSAGEPVAFTKLRSTYRHEADSAIGFQMFNDPAAMGTPAAFLAAAPNIGYAFNWFYVNSTDTAYFNSGANPVRPAGADPNLPTRAEPAYEWSGWNPDDNTADYTPAARPPAVGQPGLLRQLEQQAGQGLQRGRRQLQLRRGAPRRPARRAGQGRRSRPGASSTGPAWSGGRWPTPR